MNVMTFDYDSSYDPAAPFVEIEVDGYYETLGKRTLWAMVDSGGDTTMRTFTHTEGNRCIV